MTRFDTTVYHCEVHDNADPNKGGSLEIQHPELFEGEKKWVKGTSPFGGFNSGFVHIPPPGTSVLVMRTLNSDLSTEYFWFAVTSSPSTSRLEKYDHDAEAKELSDTVFSPSIPEPDRVYRGPNGIPDTYIWKSESGHKIELSDKVYNTPAGKEKVVLTQEDHILLETIGGKRILIDDGPGPEFSRIFLDDGAGNFIKIQTDQDYRTGEGSINVEAVGNVHITSKTGEIFINVEGGTKPIEIRNYGSASATSTIDLRCDNSDINIYAGKDVNVSAVSDMNVVVSGTLNLSSVDDMNIISDKSINFTAPEIHLN